MSYPFKVHVLGHRGQGCTDSAFHQQLLGEKLLVKYPENTLLSQRQCLIDGADGFELDTIETCDGSLAVVHTDEIQQHVLVSDYKLPEKFISRLNTNQLRELPVGPSGKGQIPLLAETLQLLKEDFLPFNRKLIVNIELKGCQQNFEDDPRRNPSLSTKVIELIDSLSFPLENVVFSSFSISYLKELSAVRTSDSLNIGVLVVPDDPEKDAYGPLFCQGTLPDTYQPCNIQTLKRVFSEIPRITSVHPEIQSLTPEVVDWIATNRLRLFTWAWNEYSPLDVSPGGQRFANAVKNAIKASKKAGLPELWIITDFVVDTRKFVEELLQQQEI